MTPRAFARHLADPALPEYSRVVDPDCPLDRFISYAVKVLRDGGVETYESCQGGPGHSFPEPTVRFFGTAADGYRAVHVAMTYGLPVVVLRRFWTVQDGDLVGPQWELTFRPGPLRQLQRQAESEGLMRVADAKEDPTREQLVGRAAHGRR